MSYELGLSARKAMPVEQWEAWLMDLRDNWEGDMPGCIFLMSGDGIAWLAQRLYERQEARIAEHWIGHAEL
jgi:hypothetical protein|tara:strand:+ start:3188 stop:3400 length:213 start_codon:yes stop_codon:yes gene_type:complete